MKLLEGKVAIITGASRGIGSGIAKVFAEQGANVAFTYSSSVESALALENELNALGIKAKGYKSNAADFNEAQKLVDDVIAEFGTIDVLINNAGIMELQELEKVNGIEKQFVVNHLGHFVLTNRLIETVNRAKQGRVVVMSIGRYKNAPEEGIQFDNLSGDKGYDPLTAYGQSKLANALFAQELSRKLKGTNTTANSVLPGVINTNLGRHLPDWKLKLTEYIGWTFMRSIEEGIATTCYVATNPKLAKVSGHMFYNCNPITPEGPHMSDLKLASRLWDVSCELTGNYLESNTVWQKAEAPAA